MTVPLLCLALLSIIGGLLGLPEFWHLTHLLKQHLQPLLSYATSPVLSHSTEWTLMLLAVSGSLTAIFITYLLYLKRGIIPASDETKLTAWQKWIYHKFYVDECYDALIRKPLDWKSTFLYRFIELQVIDAAVQWSGQLVNIGGRWIQKIQTGKIGFYIMSMVFSIILIVFLMLVK